MIIFFLSRSALEPLIVLTLLKGIISVKPESSINATDAITHLNIQQMSKHMMLSQKKAAQNVNWMA
jgi:hypothetical protein